jgi:hypothetical protein
MVNVQNIYLLAQLINSEEELVRRLEQSYNKKDAETFQSVKNELLNTQKKIAQIIATWS